MLKRFFAVLAVAVAPYAASAVPVLQLDIEGGSYDSASETIVTSESSFTVYAYATPQGNTSLDALLGRTHYLSVALTPQTGPADVAAGSFTVNGTTYLATQDMTYGVPPIEANGTAAHDGGDLGQHEIFETFFVEIPFQFVAGQTSGEYNTQDDAGQGPIAGSEMLYVAFDVDRAGLPAGYELHFDLYSVQPGQRAGDTDKYDFAPFSHDAGTSPPVPEPTAALVFAAGLLVVRAAGRRS